jgi:hypothetical protein
LPQDKELCAAAAEAAALSSGLKARRNILLPKCHDSFVE